MPSPVVDLRGGRTQYLPATNLGEYDMIDNVSNTVDSFKKPRLDPDVGTERSRVKVRSCYKVLSMIYKLLSTFRY
ncbi:hypothetical protein DPMN_147192 [Dreissena polymorpha]|uniref:Uncharacterized protein n=1 Tax=Dreissena polymorpha TaxID=45954 RepID=A0A9D4F7A7_DREPO|nr:hypothetical protein DPMN_147192 [Dreissena polymorpha]